MRYAILMVLVVGCGGGSETAAVSPHVACVTASSAYCDHEEDCGRLVDNSARSACRARVNEICAEASDELICVGDGYLVCADAIARVLCEVEFELPYECSPEVLGCSF